MNWGRYSLAAKNVSAAEIIRRLDTPFVVTSNPKAPYSSSRIMKAIAEEGPRSHNPPDEPVMFTLIDRWNAFRELMLEQLLPTG